MFNIKYHWAKIGPLETFLPRISSLYRLADYSPHLFVQNSIISNVLRTDGTGDFLLWKLFEVMYCMAVVLAI